jgi:hypothetical protein
MLLHCSEMLEGVGFEYDERCVKAAREIRAVLNFLPPLRVEQYDLEKGLPVGILNGYKPDIVFLLSMGSWLKSWRSVYEQVLALEPEGIWLETNNAGEGEAQLAFFVSKGKNVEKVASSSDDDTTGNHGRSLYFIS